MSKAFTKDDAAGDDIVVPARRPLPEGAPNYVTPRGLEALRAELRRLESTRAAPDLSATETDRARTVLAVNARIRALEERLASAVVVAGGQSRDQVPFGASVTVRGDGGDERIFEIVGVDEAETSEGRVAFVAPIARALLGRRVGDTVTLRTPRGEEELEVVAIT